MKLVVNEIMSKVVSLNQSNSDYIYAFYRESTKMIFKSHQIGDYGEKWAFISINDSYCWYKGSFHSLESLLEGSLKNNIIYQFENSKEFLEWALEQNI